MRSLPIAVAFVLVLLAPFARAQWVQQTIPLRPGWNAIFLDVQPEPADCNTLFAGLPVESAWDFNPTVSAPQFVQDLTTLIPGSPNWLTWFPPASPQSALGNLFTLRAGRPYLIKLTDSAAPVNWIITGRPSLRPITWRPGGVNFVGFHVGTTGPTFQTLFAGDTGLANQPVYTLGSAGNWQQVANLATARVESGKAYWVRCISPAQRAGTILVSAGVSDGLVFSSGAAEQSLRIRNTSAAARTISVRVLASSAPPPGQPALAGPVPLEYRRTDFANTNFSWEPFPNSLTFTGLPAGQEWNVRLGARLNGATPAGSRYQSLLEVADDAGTRWLVPVSAIPPQTTPAEKSVAAGGAPDSALAGLWIGDAVLNAVSQPANPAGSTLPRPAGGQFSFRLIVHVDAGGTARLLQSVYIVRKPATLIPDPNDPAVNIVDEPARTLVVSDESLIPSLVGVGEITGRRVSAAAFGFKDPVALTGSFGAGTLAASLALPYDHSLNPFKHRFHPDHNNLDERFEQLLPEGKESFTIHRALTLEFTGTDPLGLNPPGWGDTEIGGIYRESMTGLHRNTVRVSGSFRLVRVTRVATLNQ